MDIEKLNWTEEELMSMESMQHQHNLSESCNSYDHENGLNNGDKQEHIILAKEESQPNMTTENEQGVQNVLDKMFAHQEKMYLELRQKIEEISDEVKQVKMLA